MEAQHLPGAVCSIEELVGSFASSLEESFSSTLIGPVPPNAEILLRLPRDLRENELELLAISSWYFGDCTRILLQGQLMSRAAGHDLVRVALLSKAGADCILSNSFSERDFYGNSLRTLRRLLEYLRIYIRVPAKAREKVRRRGHRTPTSGRVSFSEKDWQRDYSSTELQNQIEQRRVSLENLFESFWGWARTEAHSEQGS
jgi:hypothetical protein